MQLAAMPLRITLSFLWTVVLLLTSTPAISSSQDNVRPLIGARYRFDLAQPFDISDPPGVWMEFDNQLGQTEQEVMKDKAFYQTIIHQEQVTPELKIMVLSQEARTPSDAANDHSAVYVFKNKKCMGYLILEPIMGLAGTKFPDKLLGPIQQLNRNDAYFNQVFQGTTQFAGRISVYEKTHDGFIERYFLIDNDYIQFEAFYPVELEATLKPYVVEYLKKVL